MKKMAIDVEKSLGYQANGRTEEARKETASKRIKMFICPECHRKDDVSDKKVFGEVRKCVECGTIMLNQF